MASESIRTFDQGSPGRRLSIIHRLSMAYLSGPLSELGIARGKIPFLMKILSCEGIVQEDLSTYLCIDRSATARALQQLEDEGLVFREEDRLDRRRKKVYPTSRAKLLQGEFVAILKAHNEILFAGFDDEERRMFMDMLNRVVENLQSEINKSS